MRGISSSGTGQKGSGLLYQEFMQMAEAARPDNGVHAGDRFISYAQMHARVLGLAAALLERDIGPGDVVALLLPNGPEMFACTHALFAIGAVAMPLGTGSTSHEVENALRKSGARAVITSRQLAPLARSGAGALGSGVADRIHVWDEHDPDGLARSDAPQRKQTQPPDLPVVPADAPALFLLSSGSTGTSKIVVHTHASVLADAQRTGKAWGLGPADRVFNMLPGNFGLGLLLGITDGALSGASVHYWQDNRPLVLARQDLLKTLAAHRITVMGAVPAMYETLAGASGEHDLAHLRLTFCGGAGLDRAVFDACRARLGIDIRQSYGLTEGIMIAHNDDDDPDANWQTVGRPCGDAVVRIDRFEETLPTGVGEVLVRTSSVMQGYLNQPDETALCLEDGWLRTGDLGRLDDQGRLYIVGRRKLLIDCQGYKVDPIEVEAVLSQHPGVRDAIVAGTGGKDQRLVAYIIADGEPPEPEDLRQFLRARLSAQKVPGLYEYRDAFPRSSTGKVLRGQLRPAHVGR